MHLVNDVRVERGRRPVLCLPLVCSRVINVTPVGNSQLQSCSNFPSKEITMMHLPMMHSQIILTMMYSQIMT